MATKKVGDFTVTTGGEPPPLVRTSKYDAVRDYVLAEGGKWVEIKGGDGQVDGQAQTLKKRYGDLIEVVTRNGELWARALVKKTTARKDG